jgi:hypothetical protein
VVTRFADCDAYHPSLAAAVHAGAANPRFGGTTNLKARGACGGKVYDIPGWGDPAAALIHARALTLAHRSLARVAVHADDTWASVYGHAEYCMPHSHLRSEVSIVYMLDPGDADPDDKYGGLFAFSDARIDWCCPRERGRMTRPLIPDMPPGTMLLFASAYVHGVNPYFGTRPRITLSWNITRQRLPGSPRPAMA